LKHTIGLPKQACYSSVILHPKNLGNEKSMQKFRERYRKISKSGLVFVLHLMKQNKTRQNIYTNSESLLKTKQLSP